MLFNHKKVYRLCKELDVLRPQRKLLNRYPCKLAKKVDVTASNQLWGIDIKYGFIKESGRFFFQTSLIDVFDRNIIAYHLGLTCKAKQVVLVLEEALKKCNLLGGKDMPVVRTDNGPQFTAKVFERACKKHNIIHERIPVKTPNMNAHIEAFHSILEVECYAIHEFSSFSDAYREIATLMRLYNERRKHGSLGYKSPMQFYQEEKSKQDKGSVA